MDGLQADQICFNACTELAERSTLASLMSRFIRMRIRLERRAFYCRAVEILGIPEEILIERSDSPCGRKNGLRIRKIRIEKVPRARLLLDQEEEP